MTIKITLDGGKVVTAHMGRHTIKTDQPIMGGGTDTAPAPYDLFLASLGTCAGIYIQGFCEQRGLPYQDISIDQTMVWDPIARKMKQIRLDINLPEGFPEKYKESVIRAAELCAVKKTIQDPPEFVVSAREK
ncbi:MAG: putative redox protein [Bacteroidales bacterium]|jgi:ribosomal protein S12 methylthiotransferase accessory factor|nr:putative redox protein [Bacteroidales bacterium]MDN5329980.1 putative redox protein [Bacteroidales bacterium]NLH53249.1 osmotically inducible protein OsmC [Bacteroidales bacterium]NPV36876.1 osmotically inducible protein OsmC [Bacteroidales bacterium]